ncbi:response regulator transcription factor [Azospira inquinata]|uniref:Response regulator transcription factor n=1 Tax=Azospira inquinata TaxID=2785627 RepID=A0A975SPS2_9RHOO|nr:response regulator transcription factor [Azospira inquinata]QWT44953.1 response regulator transcription factor [Azospira inquinata]QWT49715.1 response regulator transcription factor [Azospira inquinata]
MTHLPADTDGVEQWVFVVDDDEAMRDSLVWLIESDGYRVQSFATAEEFLDFYHDGLAGCLVLDVRMPGISGLELYERLAARQSTLPVIFVTGHGDVPMAVAALKRGAVDFIEKPFNDSDMLRLIQHCLLQERDRRAQRDRQRSVATRLESLSPREREVMDRVVEGKLNKQIADDLNISMKTVEAHRARVMEKMGVRSLAELVQCVLGVGSRPSA